MTHTSYNQRRLTAAIRALRNVHERMEMQTAYIFLLTATTEGSVQTRIAALAGVTQAAVSRNLLLLSGKGKNGLGLLKRERGTVKGDLRRVAYTLTAKGREVLRTIEHELNASQKEEV